MTYEPTELRDFNPADGAARAERREASQFLADLLMGRADVLEEHEQALLQAIYGEGKSCAFVARLSNVPVRRIQRRVRDLARRLLSPLATFVLRQRGQWNPTMARVATEVFLRGRSLKGAQGSLRMTYHAVRRQRDAVLAMFNAESARGQRNVAGAARGDR